ncbi:MAG: phenylacetate--CoA ligase family protein [Geminicoccales bacterium]
MNGYFEEADPARLMRDYPMGRAYLEGPAALSRDALRSLQEKRFAAVIARAWQVPFYRRRWSALGIEPGDIQGLDDIEKLPPFNKTDLMDSVSSNPPFGDYHGMDMQGETERPSVVFHTTSGTTGTPQPLFFGAWDREVQNLLLARAYRLQGLSDDDIVHSVYGFGMANDGHYSREAVLHFTKALFLSTGTGLETPLMQQIQLIKHFGATVLVGCIDDIKRLAEMAKREGVDSADLNIRMISSQIGQHDRAEVSSIWGGVETFDWYGAGDTGIMAAETPDRNGLHIFEDAHYVELLDADQKKPVPIGDPGNICVTMLFKTSVYPIIRFETQDVATMLMTADDTGPARMSGIEGPIDNMIKLRGINVYPTSVGTHLAGHPVTLGEYVCRVVRRGHRDDMIVVIEVKPDALGDPNVATDLACFLRQKLGVEVDVETVSAGATMMFTQIEARQNPIRLIDERSLSL